MEFERSSGILLHLISLPGTYGIGSLGKEAYKFVDFLKSAKQKLWQICPLGHTGKENSPYICYSAFAGNPLLIDLETLCKEGLLSKKDLKSAPDFKSDFIEYNKVKKFKLRLLKVAYQNFKDSACDKRKLEKFIQKNHFWLDDYALFMALNGHFKNISWSKWPNDIKFRKISAVKKYQQLLKDEIDYHQFVQYTFGKQWHAVKEYANRNGVKIFGDIPIFVSYESADVWARSKDFLLDKDRIPTHVAGVPPDYFSKTGQLWGNPLYNWNHMRKTGFRWWLEVFRKNTQDFDITRIDHFRGFEAYWKIPYGHTTAINGKWVKAPGEEILKLIRSKLGKLPFIAEDLGVITPEVEKMRDQFGLPGMEILQFSFDPDADASLPFNYKKDRVIYTGTHDNDTTRGWYLKLNKRFKEFVKRYLNVSSDSKVTEELIRLAWASHAVIAIVPFQDLLNLDSSARLNIPGKFTNIYRWRCKSNQINPRLAKRLRILTETYFR